MKINVIESKMVPVGEARARTPIVKTIGLDYDSAPNLGDDAVDRLSFFSDEPVIDYGFRYFLDLQDKPHSDVWRLQDVGDGVANFEHVASREQLLGVRVFGSDGDSNRHVADRRGIG